MRLNRPLSAFFLIALSLSLLLHAGTRQQAPSTPEVPPVYPTLDGPATSCVYDPEVGPLPDCILQTAHGKTVSPKVLKQLQFDSHGLAPILSAREGWMYVNRSGSVVVAGVPRMDNWADTFHDGLVRVFQNGKYGFANRKGQIVVPAKYDGAFIFENGKATVCIHCQTKCFRDVDCEHQVFVGGEWFVINTSGTVLASIPPPK